MNYFTFSIILSIGLNAKSFASLLKSRAPIVKTTHTNNVLPKDKANLYFLFY